MLTDTERANVFATAVEQILKDASTAEEASRALVSFRRSRCAECLDPYADPKYDGHGGMVCDICGADWRGIP